MVRYIALSGALALFMAGAGAQSGQQASSLPDAPSAHPSVTQQSQLPDGPSPQPILPGTNSITPGKGTTVPGQEEDQPDPFQTTVPASSLPSSGPTVHADDGAPPEIPEAGKGQEVLTIRGLGTNFVEVPFTVKDSKNRLVSGLTWRDIRVYENNVRQHITFWTVDPMPMSVALVVDQSVTPDTMMKVNFALGAFQGAFSAYDEVAVFTYNNSPRQHTAFTAAESARLGIILDQAKTSGRDAIWADTSGPLSQNINLNGGAMNNQMPLVNSTHGTTQSNQIVPREIHALNDAILAAAKVTARTDPGRRRIIYVISDGKEYGSQAKTKDVIKFLQTNKIAVYATLVGDSAVPGMGFLDSIHIPLTMHDNILPEFAKATGGEIDPEFTRRGIEQSFARLAADVRNQYIVGFNSHESLLDEKYRSIEVKVLRPNLTVTAKKGYFPAAADSRPRPQTGTAQPPPGANKPPSPSK